MESVWLLKTVVQLLFASSWDTFCTSSVSMLIDCALRLHRYARKTTSVISLRQVLPDILSMVSLKDPGEIDAGWSWRLPGGL